MSSGDWIGTAPESTGIRQTPGLAESWELGGKEDPEGLRQLKHLADRGANDWGQRRLRVVVKRAGGMDSHTWNGSEPWLCE